MIWINKGESVRLSAPVRGAAAYQWYKNGIPVINAMADNFKASENGVYTVMAFNAESCSSPVSEAVEVKIAESLVDVAITISSAALKAVVGEPFEYHIQVTNNSDFEASEVLVQSIFINNIQFLGVKYAQRGQTHFDQQSGSFNWQVGKVAAHSTVDLRIEVKAVFPGIITQTAEVSCREKESNLLNNKATDISNLQIVKIPNVITPNGDGINDYLVIKGLDSYRNNEVWIFNRWGNTIYHKQNYQNDWDGQGLNEGTYFYRLLLLDGNGKTEQCKGYIMLIKK